MTVSSVTSTPTVLSKDTATGMSAMGSGDFLKLLTTQLTQQDPTDPVDNKDMLAQMAQFSSLAGITESNATLKGIADKLDAILAAQQATNAAAGIPTTATQEN